MPTVAFKTLGCKLNQYETEAIRAALSRAGYDSVSFGERADVYIVNTCTVTGRSDYKSRQAVRRVCREGLAGRVVVTGCYAEVAPGVFRAFGPAVTVVRNRDKASIPAMLGAPAADVLVARFAGRTRFFLKVQDGCDHFCAYCAVRLARGPSRSVPPEQVLAAAREAIAAGAKEIVLVGVDLGAYGRDLPRRWGLPRLVSAVASLPGKFRVRLSTVDAADIDDEMVALFAEGVVCPHLHLPLQSASDDILRAMRRRYRVADFRRRCEALMENVSAIALGADVIAGLPGEDVAAFERTVSFIKEIPFAYLHVFPFSARPGTDAALAPHQVPPDEREKRAAALRELAAEKRRAFERRFIGTIREALVEGDKGGGEVALTDNYLHAPLDGYRGSVNQFVPLLLKEGPRGITGEVVKVHGNT